MKTLEIIGTLGGIAIAGSALAKDSPVGGDAPATTPAKASPWEWSAAAGLGLADGNAEALNYSIQLLGTYAEGSNEAFLGADYFYADSNGLETANAFRAYGQYNRLLSDRLYLGVFGQYLTDDVANLDSRTDLNLLVGYYLIKNDLTSLALEAGPGYSWSDQGGTTDDYATLRFAERFEHRFNSRAKIWQSLSYVPEISDFGNYLLTAELGIDTQITRQWAFRTFVRHQIDSTPAPGFEKGDTSLLFGLAYSLAGFPEAAPAGRRTLKADRTPKSLPSQGWSSTAALGLSLAKGNSDNLTANAVIETAYREERNELFANLAFNFAEDNGATSIDNIRAAIQYNRLLNDRLYAGFGSGYLRDQIADVSYRFTPAAVLGYYVLKNDKVNLSFEAGPGYTFEKTGGVEDDFLAVQAAERFAWALGDRFVLNQSVVYNGAADDLGEDFTVTASASLDTDITASLAWRLALGYTYDNQPAIGREHHDTTLSTGVAFKF